MIIEIFRFNFRKIAFESNLGHGRLLFSRVPRYCPPAIANYRHQNGKIFLKSKRRPLFRYFRFELKIYREISGSRRATYTDHDRRAGRDANIGARAIGSLDPNWRAAAEMATRQTMSSD